MLQHGQHDSDATCSLCHAPASGPCARCKALICADCATLVEASVARAALCPSCARATSEGPSPWWTLLRWPALFLLILLLLTLALRALR